MILLGVTEFIVFPSGEATIKRFLGHMLRPLLGAFVVGLLCTTVSAKLAATDGLTWAKGYPMWVQIPTKPGFFWPSAAGALDTTTYPNIKLDSAVVTMEVTQVDKNGKDVPGATHTFLNNTGADTTKRNMVYQRIEGMEGWETGRFRRVPIG